MKTSLTREVVEAKKWVAEAWAIDKAVVLEAVKQAIRELPLDAVAGVVGTCTFGMSEDKINDGMASGVLPTLFEVRASSVLLLSQANQSLCSVSMAN